MQTVAASLDTLCTDYFASVGFDTDHISFADGGGNEVCRIVNNTAGGKVTVTAYVDGQTAVTINYTAQSGGAYFYAAYQTDNAVALLIKLSSSANACLIFTKNNAGATMVISSDSSAYYAWTYTDAGAPTSTVISNDTTKSQTELVPFGSNGGSQAVSYSPHAFWCHTAPAYPTTGSISYTFVEMADQTGGRYFCNGVWAVS
jgi:hypothetical protein